MYLRTLVCMQVSPGMSQVFSPIIKSFYGSVCATDLRSSGMMLLDVRGQVVRRLFCTLGVHACLC